MSRPKSNRKLSKHAFTRIESGNGPKYKYVIPKTSHRASSNEHFAQKGRGSEDIYGNRYIQYLENSDAISVREGAFMRGFLGL